MNITNNITAFNVWKNYTSNVNGLRESMGKLSSGSRINNAGDDPAGLAMSERLRAQVRNTTAAAGNVENKLNYLQTADSWMQKIQDMLGRMGELSVMANDGTKSSTDKDVLQKEFKAMQDEIARITTGDDAAGKFNGLLLFQAADADGNGALDGIVQQVGSDGGQTFEGVAINLTTSATGAADELYTTSGSPAVSFTWGQLIDSTAIGSPAVPAISIGQTGDAGQAVSIVNKGIDFISEKRADIGAEMKRMAQTLDGLRNYQENIQSAESRIRDVDVAKETTEMTKYQILQQVGTAMLAQANQLPSQVMQLFG